MAIFNSYVKLPEGNNFDCQQTWRKLNMITVGITVYYCKNM